MADITLPYRRSSGVSKHSAEVFAEAEGHPVTVTRRDGGALVLMSQRKAESRGMPACLHAQLITVGLDDSAPLDQRMARPSRGCARCRRPTAPSHMTSWTP